MLTLPVTDRYKVGSRSIPDPSSMSVEFTPLHGAATGRTDDGTMHTELIHRGKYKVALKYDALSAQQLEYILKLVQAQYFSFTFPDVNGQRTIECCGASVSYYPDIGVYYNKIWRGVRIDFSER